MEDEVLDKITPAEFAATIKEKYPQYQTVEDSVLVEKMLVKYPEYRDKISFDEEVIPEPPKGAEAEASGGSVSPSASTESSSESNAEISTKDKDDAARRIQMMYEKVGITEYDIDDEVITKEAMRAKDSTRLEKMAKTIDKINKSDNPKEQRGYWNNLLNTDIALGSTELGVMIASVPETLYDIAAVFTNPINKLFGWEEASSTKFKEDFDVSNPILDYYIEENEKLAEEKAVFNERYESTSIYENIKSGNVTEAFQLLGSGIAQSAPVSLSMMAGGAAVSVPKLAGYGTVAFTGKERLAIEEANPELSEFTKTIKALGLGGAETVFAAVSQGTMGKVYKDIILKEGKEQGAVVFKQGLLKMYETALKKYGGLAGALGEGVEEVATTITQNMINGRPAFENIEDSFIQGVGGGALYGAPMNIANVRTKFKDGYQRRQVNKILEAETNDYVSIRDAFLPESSPISADKIELVQKPMAYDMLEKELSELVKEGEMDDALAEAHKKDFLDTALTVSKTKGVNLSTEGRVEAVGLIKEKEQLKADIKVMDDALAAPKKERVLAIDERLINLANEDKPKQRAERKAKKQEEKIQADKAKQKDLVVKNTTEEVSRINSLDATAEDGATLNQDGTKYEGTGLVVPITSVNMKQSELTPESINDFIEANSESIGAENVKVGLYKFPNSDQVSIDLNIVVDPQFAEQALEFGKESGQESLFNLETFENVKTGADGKNPVQYTPRQFKQIAESLSKGEKPVMGDVTDITKTVENANKALSKIAPDVKINTYNTQAEFEKATGDKESAGVWNPNDNTISINATKANDRTVAHEVFHAVLGTSISSDAKVQEVSDKFLEVLGKNVDGKIAEELNNFVEKYKEGVRSEEALAELAGMLANNYTSLNNKSQSAIKQWLDRVAKALGLKSVTDNDVIDLLNTLSNKIAKGEVIGDSDTSVLDNITKGMDKSPSVRRKKRQAEKLFTKDDITKQKSLLEIAEIIDKWTEENQVFDESIERLSDEEVVSKFAEHIEKELKVWKEQSGKEYISFYDEDIKMKTNPTLQKYALEKYGRVLTDYEVKTYHTISSFASPNANPLLDSWKGFFMFNRWMETGVLSVLSDKQATIWKPRIDPKTEKPMRNEQGQIIKYDTGEPFLDKDGKAKYSGVTMAVSKSSMVNLNKVIDKTGSVEKAIDWLFSTHNYKDIAIMMDKPYEGAKSKRLNENEYIEKDSKSMGVFGITGAKLGSYILNRVGDYSTVTKDMWYARTMARLAGEKIIQTSKKTGKKSVLKTPWAEGTTAGKRKRELADKAFKVVADKIGSTPAGVQEMIWDFEKRLYEKLGATKDAAYTSDGLNRGIKEDRKAVNERATKSQKPAKNIKAWNHRQRSPRANASREYREAVDAANAARAKERAERDKLAPNGKPSNLNEEQYKTVRTPEFKRWFGDWENDPKNASKVLDENGEPLVVYHGTNEVIDEFVFGDELSKIYEKLGYYTGYNNQFGTHFGTIETANRFAKDKTSKVLPLFLNVKKLLRVEDLGSWEATKILRYLRDNKGWKVDYNKATKITEKASEVLKEELSKNKIEGFIYKNNVEGGGSDSYNIFNSNQIKLADGTNKTFDPNKRSIKQQLTPQQALDKSKKAAKKAREQASGDNKTLKQKVDRAINNMVDELVDRQGSVKKALNRIDLDKVVDYMVTKSGYSAYAKNRSRTAHDKIFKGLSDKRIEQLEEILLHRRIIAVDKNRADRGLEPVKHQDGFNQEISEQALEGYREEIGDKAFDDLSKRADDYFNEYKNLLKDMRDEGLISQETYEVFAEVEYQPRVFLDFLEDMDGNILMDEIDRSERVPLSDKQIKAMKGGHEGSQIMDAWYLLQKSIQSRSAAVFANRLNKTFAKEFIKTKEEVEALEKKTVLTKADFKKLEAFDNIKDDVKEDEIVGYTKTGKPKFKLADKNTKGFKPLYFYEDGVQNRIWLREDFHQKFTDTQNTYISAEVRENVALVSGTTMVKTLATGNNPLFFITNTPRDLAFVLAFSKEYNSNVLGNSIKLMKDAAKGVKDVVSNSENYKKFLEYGGGMDYLAIQGKYKNKGWGKVIVDGVMDKRTQDKFVRNNVKKFLDKFNLASEMGIRLAVFNKSVANQMKGKDVSTLSKEELDLIYTKAVRSARELTDFNQGGKVTKALDAGLPYLNAATQGTRAGVNNLVDRPVETMWRITQITGFAAASTIGAAMGAISYFRSDDDEDKDMTNAEIYFDTLKGASEYDLTNYFIIPLGAKDERGNWKYLRIAKAQTLTPMLNTSEHYVRKAMAKNSGIEYKQDINKTLKRTFDNNILPVNLNPLDAATRVPLVDATFAWNGIDSYTGNPLTWDRGDIPAELEGIVDKNVEPLYHEMGKVLNISPLRLQSTTESFITTPSTNPYIGVLYGIGNLTGSDRTVADVADDFGKDMVKAASKRLLKSTSEYNEVSKMKERVSDDVLEAHRKHIIIEDGVRNLIKDYKENRDKETTKKEIKKLAGDNPEMVLRIVSWMKSEVKKKKIEPLVGALKFERNKEVKALILAERFGNMLLKENRGSLTEGDLKILSKLVKQKVLDRQTMLHYKRLVKEDK